MMTPLRGALAAAWDCGIRYFDTSPHYGIGHSERRTGEFLRGEGLLDQRAPVNT